MRTTLFFLLPAALLAIAHVPLARGEELLGEPWESGIESGIVRQRQDIDRGVTPQSVLRQAELQAARRSDATTQVVRLYLLARAYAQAGDRRSAISTYSEVLRKSPRCYFVHRDLAILALEQNPPDRRTAEQYLRQAIAIHPRYLTAHRNLARILLDTQRPQAAVPVLERVVDLEPSDLQARFLLAQTLLDDAQRDRTEQRKAKLDRAERAVAMLVRQEPKNPSFRELKGDVFLARRRFTDALKVYRRLAAEHPGAAQPLRKYLYALNVQREADGSVDGDAWLWALEGLSRLTRDPEEMERLRKGIEEFRRQMLQADAPPLPEGPPTDAMIIASLGQAPAEGRTQILHYVYGRSEAPSAPLFQALLARLSPAREPEAKARQWVLRTLGRFGGPGVVPLVRLSLNDTDASVRNSAADALYALAPTGNQAEGAAFLTLALYAESADAALAAAARSRVLDLAQTSVGTASDDAYAAQIDAYRTWWRGPDASEAKISALAHFPGVRDLFPEDILLPYLADGDSHVVDAAWAAMAKCAATLLEDTKVSGARRTWLSQLPPYRARAVSGPGGQVARDQLEAWAARKPSQ